MASGQHHENPIPRYGLCVERPEIRVFAGGNGTCRDRHRNRIGIGVRREEHIERHMATTAGTEFLMPGTMVDPPTLNKVPLANSSLNHSSEALCSCTADDGRACVVWDLGRHR